MINGALDTGIDRFEATSLRFAFGPLTLEVGRLVLHKLTGQVRFDAGQPRLHPLQAAGAELSGVKVRGPLIPSRMAAGQGAAGPWSLVPLAAANGTIQAEIIDAHLAFDADVTVPIRHGEIDFSAATVEHVGPDSRMGVSRQGLYVDAPNGRSHVYQFPSAPVAGVEYEQRKSLLGPFVSDRGKLKLQAFVEGMLSRAQGAQGVGFTRQARPLFDRTALAGEVRLGDGKFAAPGVQAELTGRAAGSNVIRLHSDAVGRGFSAEIASLSVRDAVLDALGMQLGCAEIGAALIVRVLVEGPQLRFELDLETVKIAGLRFGPPP